MNSIIALLLIIFFLNQKKESALVDMSPWWHARAVSFGNDLIS